VLDKIEPPNYVLNPTAMDTLPKGTVIADGSTAKIILDSKDSNYVYKIYKTSKYDEVNFHYQIYSHLENEMSDLGVAVPPFHIDNGYYRMRRIDTSKPLYDENVWASLTPNLQKEYLWRARIFLKSLAGYGLFLKNVEAYIQDDDTIMFIDFGDTYRAEPSTIFRIESSQVLPLSITKEWTG
jgi:hypothetical protein